MWNIALVPKSYILHCSNSITTNQPRHSGNALTINWIAFMRHCGRAFLPRLKIFFRLANVSALKVANFSCDFFKSAGNYRKSRHIFGVAIALNNLSCQFHRFKSQFLANKFFDFRIDIWIGTNCAAQFANADNFFSMLDTLNITLNFRAPQRQFQAKCHRLGVYPMRASNAGRMLKFSCATPQNFTEIFQIVKNNISRLFHH